MTREDVLREFDMPSLYGMVEGLADEVVRLRAKLQAVRTTAEHLLGFVLVGGEGGFRPQAGSFVTPLEFHQATTHAMRDVLALQEGEG